MNDLISIIIPVYKVEKELERCVNSLLNQTYKNLEIILVDDGSPDKCPKMCDNYAKQDSRVVVIHKENGGLSDARNAGLKIVKGDYIAFVDSDDWVEADFIETLYQNAKKENADISIVGYTLVWDGGKTRRFSNDEDYIVLNQDQAIRELLKQKNFQCMVCQKLYKTYIFDGVRFPAGKLYEDVAISLPTFVKVSKVVVSGVSKYNYFQRSTSIVNSEFNTDKLYFLECCRNIIDYSNKNSKIYDKEAHTFYLRALMTFTLQIYRADNKKNEIILQQLEKEIRQQKKYIWSNSYLELRKKIVITLICFHFPRKILVALWKKRVEE